MARGRSIISSLVFVVLVLAIAWLGAYLYTLTQVKVESVRIDKLGNLSLQGFTADVTVTIRNDGVLPVTLKRATYSVTIDENWTIGSGELEGTELPSGKSTEYAAKLPIEWQPSVALAARLLANQNTTAHVEGTIIVGEFGLFEATIPYNTDFDLKEYVAQFMPNNAQGILDAALGFAKQFLPETPSP